MTDSDLLTDTVWDPPEGCELAWVSRDGALRGLMRWVDGAWLNVSGPVAALCDGCGAFAHLCACERDRDCEHCQRFDCICDEAHDEPELFG